MANSPFGLIVPKNLCAIAFADAGRRHRAAMFAVASAARRDNCELSKQNQRCSAHGHTVRQSTNWRLAFSENLAPVAGVRTVFSAQRRQRMNLDSHFRSINRKS